MNIYQKLAEVRKLCEVITKSKSGYGYRYTPIDEILARVTAGMKKHGLSLIPSMSDSITVEPRSFVKIKRDKAGNPFEEPNSEFIVRGFINYTWVNDENPEEKITVPWFFTGSQSDPAQAFGSALTYAERYFLLQYFQIATPEDDPDAWKGKQAKADTDQTLQQVHLLVTAHLEKKPGDRDKVISIIQKYAKENGKPSPNYFTITDPNTASRLLDELTGAFVTGGQ